MADKISIIIKYLRPILELTDPDSLKSFDLELENLKPKRPSKAKPKIALNEETWEWAGITEQDLAFWKRTFPALDIPFELAKAAGWIRANPERRKVNYARYLFNWLSRQQGRARVPSLHKSDERADAWARGGS